MKRIIITGATGFIGSKISAELIKRGDEVVVLSRSSEKARQIIQKAYKYVDWNFNSMGEWIKEIEEADAIIHLAGENIMGARWSDTHKKKVLNSRVLGTGTLVNAICQSSKKPSFICASAIGFYNNSIDVVVDEESPSGSGFLSEVTQKWEVEAVKVKTCGSRSVTIRTGIVLDKNEGALAKMITPFKFFIGGPLGSGKQWIPWIHIDDIANLFVYAIDNEITGILNGVAPNAVRMKEFAKVLGKVLNRPSFFRVPEFILNLILGEAAYAVTKGSKVLPNRTLDAGYKFNYTDLREALKNIL